MVLMVQVYIIPFFYGNKESTTLLASIFTQLTNAQQHYMHISYTRFHPNWAVNVEYTDMN